MVHLVHAKRVGKARSGLKFGRTSVRWGRDVLNLGAVGRVAARGSKASKKCLKKAGGEVLYVGHRTSV